MPVSCEWFLSLGGYDFWDGPPESEDDATTCISCGISMAEHCSSYTVAYELYVTTASSSFMAANGHATGANQE